MALALIYKPKDEFTALTLKALLEQQGIRVMLKSYQMPWYDSIAMVMRPEWGELWVAEADREAAQAIVDDFVSRGQSVQEPAD